MTLAVPRGWQLKEEVLKYALKQGETCELPFEIDLPKAKRRFMNNILNINLSVNGVTVNLKAGLPVSKQWLVTKIMAGQQAETFAEETRNSPEQQITFIEESSRYFTVPAGAYILLWFRHFVRMCNLDRHHGICGDRTIKKCKEFVTAGRKMLGCFDVTMYSEEACRWQVMQVFVAKRDQNYYDIRNAENNRQVRACVLLCIKIT